MHVRDGGFVDDAVAALAARSYGDAAEAYTRAGWRVLSEPRDGQSPFDPDAKGWVGGGLRCLATAAVAHRVAGAPERATRRGRAGIAAARDLRGSLTAPAQSACLLEFVADFRAVAGLDGAADAYRDAAAAYGDAAPGIEDPRTPATTPLFEAAAGTIRQVARGGADGEVAVAWADLHGDDPAAPGDFLADRARYKRRRFPGLVERAVEAGHLAAPRGTTEYDTDAFRCPACGSTDVNRVGAGVLCLRCSTPMDRRS